jgi:glycosyltransferase involved in cell wall biosynthesis
VEGFSDIRFVTGLSEVSELTMAVPAKQYTESGLKERVAQSGSTVSVAEIPGGRLRFQLRSLAYLWKHAGDFDVILAQEALRGALNANLVGKLRRVPVVNYMNIPPLEYFRCRRERGQIGRFKSALGEVLIRSLLTVNGRLASCCLAVGPYLQHICQHSYRNVQAALAYGVDTQWFRPVTHAQRLEFRQRLDLPKEKFIVLLSSRISHEKDPETVLRAISLARAKGLDAIVLNIGGGYREFLNLARNMGLRESEQWVLGRPAVHPITELHYYYGASDMLAQASLAENAAMSTLEALACGIPVVASAVGGMAVQLEGYARLAPRRNAEAMAEQILWVAANPEEASAQALEGREYIIREWERKKAFAQLLRTLKAVSCGANSAS